MQGWGFVAIFNFLLYHPHLVSFWHAIPTSCFYFLCTVYAITSLKKFCTKQVCSHSWRTSCNTLRTPWDVFCYPVHDQAVHNSLVPVFTQILHIHVPVVYLPSISPCYAICKPRLRVTKQCATVCTRCFLQVVSYIILTCKSQPFAAQFAFATTGGFQMGEANQFRRETM